MIRKIAFSLVATLLVLTASCKCAAEKGAVGNVAKSHERIASKLLKYVDADPLIAGAQLPNEKPEDYEARKRSARDDWHKLVESDFRNIESLRKSLGD